jgi:hypothetical protein
MAGDEMESMILHEIGEARAGELLGERWHEMLGHLARTRAEVVARAVRDLLADCLSTLPELVGRANLPALHFHFATYDGARRELFPQALQAYGHFLESGELDRLAEVVRDGARCWLAAARAMLAAYESDRDGCRAAIEALLEDAPRG